MWPFVWHGPRGSVSTKRFHRYDHWSSNTACAFGGRVYAVRSEIVRSTEGPSERCLSKYLTTTLIFEHVVEQLGPPLKQTEVYPRVAIKLAIPAVWEALDTNVNHPQVDYGGSHQEPSQTPGVEM